MRISFVVFDTGASLIWVMIVAGVLGAAAGVAVTRLVARRGRPAETQNAIREPADEESTASGTAR